MAPRLEMKSPYGLGEVRPPSGSWEELQFSELGQFEVVFTERHDDDLDIPDKVLLPVFSVLEEQIIIASGMLEEIDTYYFPSPSCYPERAVEGEEHFSKGAEILTWFVHLFDRVAMKWPELANAHVTTWPVRSHFSSESLDFMHSVKQTSLRLTVLLKRFYPWIKMNFGTQMLPANFFFCSLIVGKNSRKKIRIEL
ncbi:Uncharacterised protein [Klebsiella quasipneumoniae]|nr:Uncharacterised protein [Klebsiella quasipneumoniae]